MSRLLLTALCLSALVALSIPAVNALGLQAQGDEAKLQGKWMGYVVDGKGDNPDTGPLKLELVVKGNKMTATDLRANKALGEGTFKLDPSKKVKEIDASGIVQPAPKSRSFPGIYEVQGDTLKWCVDNQGKARPTEFASRRGQYLLILKRQKS